MPIAKRTIGKDFNYFNRVAVAATSFGDLADAAIPFPVRFLTFHNEGSGGTNVIEYSFNGNTVHGDMTPGTASASLTFEDRAVSGIWLRVKSGSTGPINVRIEAWASK